MTVLNKYKDPIPADAIYIGRGSKWGNPFVMRNPADRDMVCESYEKYLHNKIRDGELTAEDLAELHGKDLVCFCAPKRCHGDILEDVARQAVEYLNKQGER